MVDTFNIRLTRQELGLLGQVLGEGPYKLVAPLIQNIVQQVQVQETENAFRNQAAGKVDGGGSPWNHQELGGAPGSSEGIQPS